jgi:hypothetical protein
MDMPAARARRKSLWEDVLVVGIGMHRGHQALPEPERIHEHLHDRREAVRGAARVGDDVMAGGVVVFVVHPENDGDVLVLGRGRNDDLLCPSGQMVGGPLPVPEDARGLDDHVDTELCPGKLRWIPLGKHLEVVAVDLQSGVRYLHGARVLSVHRVVLEKVGEGVVVRQIVDGDKIEVGSAGLLGGPQYETTDTSKTVDRDTDSHRF